MSNNPPNGSRAFVTAITASAIPLCITIVAWWITKGKDLVTRTECYQMIQETAPWVKERTDVLHTLENLTAGQKELKDGLRSVERNQIAVMTTLKIPIP